MSPTSLEHLVDTALRQMPFDGGQPAQVVAAGAARVDVAGVEQRADLVQRLAQTS